MEYTVYTMLMNEDWESYCNTLKKDEAVETAYIKWVNCKDEKKYQNHAPRSGHVFKSVWVEDEDGNIIWDSDDIVIQAKAEAEEILNNVKITIDGNNIIIDDGFCVEKFNAYKPDVDDITEKLEMYVYYPAKVLRNDDIAEMLEKKAEEVFN